MTVLMKCWQKITSVRLERLFEGKEHEPELLLETKDLTVIYLTGQALQALNVFLMSISHLYKILSIFS